MRVLVCGGRDYADMDRVREALDGLDPAPEYLIEGGARGADRLAKGWAHMRGVPVLTYPAKWDEFGKRAGILRNAEMLEHGKPDLVVAFPGGRGTADMVQRAERAGVPVMSVA